MDHLIQIPQVDRAWEPIPEPWVTLGLVAGLDTRLRLGTLVTPVTFRPAGHHRQGGGHPRRAVGRPRVRRRRRGVVGPRARGVRHPFPAGPRAPGRARGRDRDHAGAVGRRHQGLRRGARQPAGDDVLPAARPAPIPVIVGGNGERRTLAIAARLGDGCNLPSDVERLDRKLAVLRRHLDAVDRPYDDLEVTVLDLPVVGRDRDDVWARVERHRGRTPAAAYAAKKHAGTVAQQRDRYAALADRGVGTVFVSTPDLDGPDDVLALAGLTAPSASATSARRSSGRAPGGPRSAAGSAGCPRRCRGSWSRGPTSRAARPRRTRRCRTARRTTA